MKAIILISSLFYIIGLKIGNKIDLTSKSSPVEKVITNKISPDKCDKTFEFKSETNVQSQPDSVKNCKPEGEIMGEIK